MNLPPRESGRNISVLDGTGHKCLSRFFVTRIRERVSSRHNVINTQMVMMRLRISELKCTIENPPGPCFVRPYVRNLTLRQTDVSQNLVGPCGLNRLRHSSPRHSFGRGVYPSLNPSPGVPTRSPEATFGDRARKTSIQITSNCGNSMQRRPDLFCVFHV